MVACSEDDQTEDTNVTAEDQETETEQKTNSSNESNSGESITEESVDQAELQPVTEVEITEASEPRDLEEYIEMDRVMKDVDVDSHALHVVTDHPGKRVIIYTKDEEQLYKSVYVKKKLPSSNLTTYKKVNRSPLKKFNNLFTQVQLAWVFLYMFFAIMKNNDNKLYKRSLRICQTLMIFHALDIWIGISDGCGKF